MPRAARRFRFAVAVTSFLLTTFGVELSAQVVPHMLTAPRLGSPAEDRLRTSQLTGEAVPDGYLNRTLSSLLPPSAEGERLELLDPAARLVWNSEIPFSPNEGTLWAGRGANALLTGGARLRWRSLEIVFSPEATFSQNLNFQTLSANDTVRSQFASPWHIRDQSADVPLRFGDVSIFRATLGQSSVSARWNGLRAGVSNENEWWGPGIKNAILISNNAEAFPHLFLSSNTPWRTSVGEFEARWILGTLAESLYFDRNQDNDLRALNGAIFVFRPSFETNLSLGLGRVVYSSITSPTGSFRHGLDAFTWWKNQILPPDSSIAGASVAESEEIVAPPAHDHEQITSAFARWIFPNDGLEVFVEWARLALPTSFGDFLSEPQHSQGYTLGLQWLTQALAGQFRLQLETTYLEESSTFNNRPVPSYYVSRSVPQGYTNRGRVIGASVGPGGSGQWVAADYLAGEWKVGVFLGRNRLDNDVYYRGRDRLEVGHDVLLYGGIRGGGHWAGLEIQGEVIPSYRFNYLFQNPTLEPVGLFAIDKPNFTMGFTVAPAATTRR